MLRLKIEYSDKHLQNLNLSYISLIPIFTYPYFFFEPLSNRLLRKFQFRKFRRIFRAALQPLLLYSGEIVAFSALFAKDPGGLIILTLINPPVRFSSPCSHRTSGSPSLFHRPFLFPPAKDLTLELQHGR